MKVARTLRDLKEALEGKTGIGLVPTMGAFHEGHLSLMRAARAECSTVAVSLFVNPLQFGPQEDFAAYPRDEPRDLEMADREGVDVVFAPSVDEVYPRRTTLVRVLGVSERWEGEHRPGHFDGVATVVLKLFNMVRPDVAYFGMKDLQQCAVVRRMVEDLNLGVRLSFMPTFREPDGLAMSSRNAYLSPEERALAPVIYRELSRLKSRLTEVDTNEGTAEEIAASARKLESSSVRVQYLAVVDTGSLEPLPKARAGASIIFAGYLGRTRLIDNVQL